MIRHKTQTQSHFNINADCFLIHGAKRGALYNLTTGDVYSIDPVAVRVVEGCEAGTSITEIAAAIEEADREQVHAFLEKMANEKMGTFSGEGGQKAKIDLERHCRTLDFLWLELREDCNLRCRHCYCMSSPTVSDVDRLTHDEWLRLLEEGREVGTETVQFIGGEPLLYGDGLFDLAEHAHELGYTTIELFSNLTFMRDEWLEKIVGLNIKVAVSIYAKRPEIHDMITTKRGSFERTMRTVRRLKERGVQPRFALTVMKHNQDYLEETMEFLKEMGNPTPGFDLVRPSGRGNDEEIMPDKLSKKEAYRTQAEFMRTDRETFIRRFNGNGCWQGKLAVSSTGNVHPCIMSRSGDSGNVRERSLKEIVDGPLRKYWDLSYDRIEICKDCEYRYACKDCRPVTIGSTGELTAKSIHCSYDPYSGEWVDTV
jgi:radical SAM protein with 4Fe4S-binding SPASM domain